MIKTREFFLLTDCSRAHIQQLRLVLVVTPKTVHQIPIRFSSLKVSGLAAKSEQEIDVFLAKSAKESFPFGLLILQPTPSLTSRRDRPRRYITVVLDRVLEPPLHYLSRDLDSLPHDLLAGQAGEHATTIILGRHDKDTRNSRLILK